MSNHMVYFSMRGRGEPIRWVCKAKGIALTEENIDLFTQWKDKKNDYDWKKLPILVVNNQQLHQTTVIARYLAETNYFISHDLWTVTRQQEVVEGVHDVSSIMTELFIARLRNQDSFKNQMYEKAKQVVPVVFGNVEKAITDDGWIYSHEMTWVDPFIASYMESYSAYFPGTFDDLPKCQELLKRVTEIPRISDWIENRPQWHVFETPIGLQD